MNPQLRSRLSEDLYNACLVNRVDDVRALTEETTHPDWDAILHVAATTDATDVVAFSLKQGAKVTEALMSTIIVGEKEATHRLLIEAKAVDVDYYVEWFGDVLGIAARDGHASWVRFLLEHGANPYAHLIEEEKTVLAVAAEGGHKDVVEVLLEHFDWSERSGGIIAAAEAGQMEIVKLLLEKGLDVNEIGIECPVDARSLEDVGTALHKAIENGHVEIAVVLLDAGIDVQLRDGKGRTAQQLAEEKGQTSVLERMRRDAK